MSRRRYISTNISTDPKLAALSECGTLPMLLYTWAIPHMDDWGRMTGEPLEFKLIVCPALNTSTEEIGIALQQIAEVGLWQLYKAEGKQYVAIPEDKWFKHQSYIAKSKREDDSGSYIPAPPSEEQQQNQQKLNNAEERREVPQNPASLSPSPSPSVSKEIDKHIQSAPAEPTKHKADQQAIFDHWNQQGIIKHRALSDKIKRAINGALREYSVDEIKQAISNYAEILRGEQYYFSYKWTLKHFLQRGLEQFLEWKVCSKNYARGDPLSADVINLQAKKGGGDSVKKRGRGSPEGASGCDEYDELVLR